MADRLLDTARAFAAALDSGDHEAARALLGDHCVYVISDATTVIGADAILEHFQAEAAATRRRFDEVDFGSHVERTSSASVVIHVAERMRHHRAWHEYRCRRYVQLGENGLIESILLEELPGELEALRKFEKKHGILSTE